MLFYVGLQKIFVLWKMNQPCECDRCSDDAGGVSYFDFGGWDRSKLRFESLGESVLSLGGLLEWLCDEFCLQCELHTESSDL